MMEDDETLDVVSQSLRERGSGDITWVFIGFGFPPFSRIVGIDTGNANRELGCEQY